MKQPWKLFMIQTVTSYKAFSVDYICSEFPPLLGIVFNTTENLESLKNSLRKKKIKIFFL